ncbi:MAG: RAMP superfamily CRISPR-associated protein [Thermoproteota archaeon]
MKLVMDLRLKLHTGFHTTGDRATPWSDRACAKEGDSFIIPASNLKGLLRSQVERVLKTYERALDTPICESPSPSSMCGKCMVCKYFGSPRNKAKLKFSDARPPSNLPVEYRTGVALSRWRKVAQENLIYTTEVPWASELHATIEGEFQDREEALEAVVLTYIGLKMSLAVAADRSRGLGWIDGDIKYPENFEARLDGETINESEIKKKLGAIFKVEVK